MSRYLSIGEWLCLAIVVVYAFCIISDIVKKKYKSFDFIASVFIFILTIVVTFIMSPAFVIGQSMDPTLHDKQILSVNKIDRDFEVNDIVVVYSKGLNKKIIKRIVATEGETVSMKDGQLYVNNNPVVEDYETMPTFESFDDIIVPEGAYFLLGDNRANSLDSRFESVGCVEKKYILGKTFSFK